MREATILLRMDRTHQHTNSMVSRVKFGELA